MKLGLALVFCLVVGCHKAADEQHAPPPASAAAPVAAPASAAAPASPPATPVTASAVALAVPPGSPPPDGKYERVLVEGVTVPMVEIMDHGATVLVDTDGKKPRTWEEQYKRKRATQAGELDVHKTDANKDGKFDDDAIDREGRWVLDAKGNIIKG